MVIRKRQLGSARSVKARNRFRRIDDLEILTLLKLPIHRFSGISYTDFDVDAHVVFTSWDSLVDVTGDLQLS